jgi:sortase A
LLTNAVALPTTTASTAPPTTVTPIAVAHPSKPVAAPRDSYAAEPIVTIGSIEIPKIGLVSQVQQGISLRNIDLGPSHWPGTAMPGEVGNTVFAGHRVTHTHPFMDMDLLAPGDRIIVDMPYGTFTYAITSMKIVQPEEFSIITPTQKPTITLFACHPKHSAAQRIVVKGKLVGTKLKPGGKPVPLPKYPAANA